MYRILLWLKNPSNTLWVMPAVGALTAILIAFAAKGISILLPTEFLPNIKADTLGSLLDSISNSMLAVSTFSLSIMVAAFAAASNNATPRATSLVMADDYTRLAIASFISAFIFASIAKIALGLDYYNRNGQFILFVSTIGILGFVITVLIRWVHTLSRLGRLDNTIEKVRYATMQSYATYLSAPNFGANGTPPNNIHYKTLIAQCSGYLSHIDLQGLEKIAIAGEYHFHLHCRPGQSIYKGDSLITVYGFMDDANIAQLSSHIIVENQRNYEQDPQYGLIVLSEIAQRALSPAVNDPGTAMGILGHITAILIDTEAKECHAKYPHLSIIHHAVDDFIQVPFDPIARDGAGTIEIALKLQKSLSVIAKLRPDLAVACRKQAQRALKYAEQLPIKEDVDTLKRLHQRLFEQK